MKSESHKFIFIHIPKSAGTSVRLALQPFESEYRLEQLSIRLMLACNQLTKKISGKKYFWPHYNTTHRTAFAWKKRLRSKYDDYFTFSFVRNPFDRAVSTYFFLRKTPTAIGHEFAVNHKFSEFIKVRYGNAKKSHLQTNFIVDNNKEQKCIVDFIGRFENIESDFSYITKKIGVNTYLPHVNQTNKKQYTDYFDQEIAEMVAFSDKKDFENFGYSTNIEDFSLGEIKLRKKPI